MKRYLYTDTLAAAWMAKHFEMQVTRTRCHLGDGSFGESTTPVPIWIMARDVENQVSEHVKYYVHPDSLYLLEPLINDVIWTVKDGFYEVRRICDVYDKPRNNTWQLYKIIERNGIAFHWPESEEA